MTKATMLTKVGPLGLALVISIFLSTAPKAQEGYWGHRHATYHYFYKDLIRPDTGSPCCDDKDCRPTSGRAVNDHYEVKVDGKWIPVPWDKVVKATAPDLGFHVCSGRQFGGQPHQLYCVVLPPES